MDFRRESCCLEFFQFFSNSTLTLVTKKAEGDERNTIQFGFLRKSGGQTTSAMHVGGQGISHVTR